MIDQRPTHVPSFLQGLTPVDCLLKECIRLFLGQVPAQARNGQGCSISGSRI